MRELMTVMTALYDSEINCGMSSFWDDGFTVWLGDDMNGIKAKENFKIEELPSAGEWLHEAAVKHYPGSAYSIGPQPGHQVTGTPSRLPEATKPKLTVVNRDPRGRS